MPNPINPDTLYQWCLGIQFNGELHFLLDRDLSDQELSDLQLRINQNRRRLRLDEIVGLSRKEGDIRNIDAHCYIGQASEEIIYQECLKMEAGSQMVFRPDFDPALIKEKLSELFDRIREGREKPGTIFLYADYNKIKVKCLLSPSK